MKKRYRMLRIAGTLCMAALFLAGCAKKSPESTMKREIDGELRGVWVSTVWGLDYPSAPTTSEAELKSQADAILEGADQYGFNAVFLQVRPCCDALYPSEIYPWSKYLTGQQGTAPDGEFDLLEYWVSQAHERGLELHAWINPYQVTRSAGDWDLLAADSPAVLHPDWVIMYGDRYYFDPSLPEVRGLVVDGAAEIVENYEVDGIHMDDYFYPGADFDDAASFAASGGDFADIGDWRRHNVDLLIQEMDQRLHELEPELEFGVSPVGIWASDSMIPGGSATTGPFNSYFGVYADTRKWVQEGWVDYIAPQLYWAAGDAEYDFTTLADWWSDLVAGTKGDVRLYIGLADYKTAEEGTEDSPWYEGKEIARQVRACAEAEQVGGTIHFRYRFIQDDPNLQRVLQEAYGTGDPPTS